ncbi:MAG: hypothetical protein FJ206_17155 [Gemmatimonadetes bacterium]|nr:hypothetical protein [Gemmatimonadota bacterium]
MNVSCTSCQTVFRVDPAKVPAGGVRARCSVCRGVFWVRVEAAPPAVTAVERSAPARVEPAKPEPKASPVIVPIDVRPPVTPTPSAPVEVAGAAPKPGLPPAVPEPGRGLGPAVAPPVGKSVAVPLSCLS